MVRRVTGRQCPCVPCLLGRGRCACRPLERRAGSCGTCNREAPPGQCSECWPRWSPPLTCIDPAARRVAWVLWAFCAVVVAGLVAYGCAS